MRLKCFRGTLSKQKRCLILRICSRDLYKTLVGKRASLQSFQNGFIILKKDPQGMKFVKSSKGDMVRIAVSKYIDSFSGKKISVKVSFRGFQVNHVVQYDVALQSSIYKGNDIPNRIYWIKAFLRGNKRGVKITMHRKAIANLAKASPLRVLFQHTKKGIVLRKSEDLLKGRKLYSRPIRKNNSHVTEIAYPKELRNRFTGYIGIPIDEFKITSDKFSMTETEGQLLLELINRGLEPYPGTTHTLGDIILPNGGYIEVTNFNPSGKKNSRHTSSIMQIRGRVFEAEHLAIHRNVKPIFIVINKSWAQNGHLQEEAKEAERHNVFTFFTDFKAKWEKPIATKIMNIYEKC